MQVAPYLNKLGRVLLCEVFDLVLERHGTKVGKPG